MADANLINILGQLGALTAVLFTLYIREEPSRTEPYGDPTKGPLLAEREVWAHKMHDGGRYKHEAGGPVTIVERTYRVRWWDLLTESKLGQIAMQTEEGWYLFAVGLGENTRERRRYLDLEVQGDPTYKIGP